MTDIKIQDKFKHLCISYRELEDSLLFGKYLLCVESLVRMSVYRKRL